MGKQKKVREFKHKKLLKAGDVRLKKNQDKRKGPEEQEKKKEKVNYVAQTSSALFFKYNTQLGPPYRVLIDTNFINFSVQNKLEVVTEMMNCLYAKCIPIVTDCVVAELEKLGQKYRVALRLVKDPRFERITCTHKGTYADDCLVKRVEQFVIFFFSFFPFFSFQTPLLLFLPCSLMTHQHKFQL